tara:strand:- start:2466 stop:2945 length:480 start_codon:yes stop_codon:yes gene_type:complete
MIIIGIDPGINGAISIVENKKILEVHDTPTMIDGKKNKRQINGAQVTNIIKEVLNGNEEVVVVVEHVNAMPGQGVTSMFNFGQSFGVIKGICAALSVPIYFVRPSKWKKHFNLIKTNKDASRTKVIEAYPDIASKLHRKKDSNRADAILIALYFGDTNR